MPPSELLDVIRQVHSGKKRIPEAVASQLAEHMSDENLTEREVEVLKEVANGNRNRTIAEKLFISEETVKVHIKHIMEKLGATDRTQAGRNRRTSRHNPDLTNLASIVVEVSYIVLAILILAAAIALLGPGAFSIDARLFGHREIVIQPQKGAVRHGD